MFDFSDYHVRELDINQGYKPLDFGSDGLTGSVNKDGRIIAINNYHPEYGYVTLTSIPPFPDANRYDQSKVREYRKSLVTNEGFGLRFEQEIIKREYYLIEDAVPLMRFTLTDGTIAECVTTGASHDMIQIWKFSTETISVKYSGKISLQRAAYTQLTEGGIVPMPSSNTIIRGRHDKDLSGTAIENPVIKAYGYINIDEIIEEDDGLRFHDKPITLQQTHSIAIVIGYPYSSKHKMTAEARFYDHLGYYKFINLYHEKLILSRAKIYVNLCMVRNCILTDHMILPLLWTRDAYYCATLLGTKPTGTTIQLASALEKYLQFVFNEAWRGTYWKSMERPLPSAWGRSYMANGMPKDNRAYQLDQQLYPLLALVEYVKARGNRSKANCFPLVESWLDWMTNSIDDYIGRLIPTDETPADDDIPLKYHFSSQVLLWRTLEELQREFAEYIDEKKYRLHKDYTDYIRQIFISQHFITEHNGKKLYAYATDGQGNYHLYHDANDMPLVMMPLWGFCSKDDPVWRNTIEFAFSDDNPGFFDGVLGSVHTPAPWSLGDAQELILCKVIGNRDRYQRVWERIEKAAQWDGALPEAYDAKDFSVVSRHWVRMVKCDGCHCR